MAHDPLRCRFGPDRACLCYPREGQLFLRQLPSSISMSSFRTENFFTRVMELNLTECIPTLKAKNFTT